MRTVAAPPGATLRRSKPNIPSGRLTPPAFVGAAIARTLASVPPNASSVTADPESGKAVAGPCEEAGVPSTSCGTTVAGVSPSAVLPDPPAVGKLSKENAPANHDAESVIRSANGSEFGVWPPAVTSADDSR